MKKLFTILISSTLLLACSPNVSKDENATPQPVRPSVQQPVQPSVLPLEMNLDVPFIPQAPDGNWKQPWQDSCEEAAALLAYYYATGKTPTKEEFKKDILSLIDWENENFGSYKDTDIEQTAEMLKAFETRNSKPETRENTTIRPPRRIELRVLTDPTIEQLKQELSQKHVIVAPFAGQQLHNPYYSNDGPYYHMMVIKGYDEKNFITNDIGTRRGKDFKYPYETIISAMHEWNENDINLGTKKVIVVY